MALIAVARIMESAEVPVGGGEAIELEEIKTLVVEGIKLVVPPEVGVGV